MKTLLPLILSLLLLSCGTPDPSTGITTIPNKLRGTIVNASGSSVENAVVYLYGDTTITLAKKLAINGKKLLAIDTTNTLGAYGFSIDTEANFTILSISSDSTQVLYKENFFYNPNIKEERTDTIEVAASITGTIDSTIINTMNNYFISIDNTPFVVKINKDGSYTLPIVPIGFWSIKLTEQDTINKTQKSVIITHVNVSTPSEIIIEGEDDTTEVELKDEEFEDNIDEVDEIDEVDSSDEEEVDEIDSEDTID